MKEDFLKVRDATRGYESMECFLLCFYVVNCRFISLVYIGWYFFRRSKLGDKVFGARNSEIFSGRPFTNSRRTLYFCCPQGIPAIKSISWKKQIV